ncbi:hypothetical protein P152DRAFT_390159 [Eremomyces bilateralis CBS 781.70]|uniref:Major facilitator superfamily (MFS) profile domain-containing protein n=1 Tax=Eremomyces bilateralis CBS 781.70 TaxID=1392243 RepID=A0A6G1GCJ8_9PEZI|nr:uncharacterized protein P152DRAFT_390159 [Eremomyces bilateralis CBS 781.70]KAF1815722.1 hypothetical protein P152DRAFT_390159 [Eremomyces bilateralis CBS 781.70]
MKELQKFPHSGIQTTLPKDILFIVLIGISHFMTQAALGQALAPLDNIGEEFASTNPGELSWFVAAYSLTVGTFIMISGRLGDIMGHKRIFTVGWLWFGCWSAFAGFSAYPRKQVFFDICRAMQGIGPALLMPNGMALLARAYPPGLKKNIAFAVFGGLAPMGFVIGALSGSVFAQYAWWPWAFWSFALACFGLGVLSTIIIPKALSVRPTNPPTFDATGSVVGVTGLILVNVAWNNGPLFGWDTPHVYFLLLIGLLFLVAFVWVEQRATDPIVPFHALNSTVGYVLALVGFGWAAFGIWVFYVFRFAISLRGESPLTISAQYIPAIFSGLMCTAATGFLLTHAPVTLPMLLSMLVFCVGIVVAAMMPVRQTYWAQLFVSILIMPFGMDMSFPAASVIVSNHLPPEHQGLAGSLINTVVNYSISIALGIAGTVEVSIARNDPARLEKGIRSAFYIAIALSLMGVVLSAIFMVRTFLREGWKITAH